MNLKERFENYGSRPDEEVWKSIHKELHRRKMGRLIAMSVAVALLLVAAVMAYWPKDDQSQTIGYRQDQPTTNVQVVQEEQHSLIQQNADEQHQKESKKSLAILGRSNIIVTQESNVSKVSNVAKLATVKNEGTSQQQVQAGDNNTKASYSGDVVVNTNKSQSFYPAQTSVDEHHVSQTLSTKTSKPKTSAVTQNDSLMVWIPNAFSPDEQGGADVRVFRIRAKENANIGNYKMYIYNRAGAQVYHGTNIAEGWDGTYRGTKCPMGSYVYIIEYTDANKGVQQARGTVTLIR